MVDFTPYVNIFISVVYTTSERGLCGDFYFSDFSPNVQDNCYSVLL